MTEPSGRVRMIDVGGKAAVPRQAIARGRLRLQPATLERLQRGELPKGPALAVAETAAILAAKRTAELLPLCHPLPLDAVELRWERPAADRLEVETTVRTRAPTGVEMEALTATAVALLTLVDMLKGEDGTLVIEEIRLVRKTKGLAA